MSSSAEEEEEDEGQEQGESSKHRSSSQTGAQRQQQRSGGARPKEEKKARKSFTKLGFKPVENVQRVCIRRNGTLLTIEQPDVLKSSTSNQHYVVFGEAKLDDASAVARRMPPSEPLANDSYGVQPLSVSSSSPLFSVQGSSLPSSGSEPAVPPAAVASAFPVSSALPSSAVFAATAAPATPESGDGASKSADTTENGETEKIDDSDVSLRDVQLVCSEAGVTQKKAARALRDNGHDVVAAMLEF